MNVTIVSPFRDAEALIPAYRSRAAALEHAAERLRFVLVEGDSRDQTLNRLVAWAVEDERVRVLLCNTGKPRYGSIVHPERFEVLARVFNTGLDAVDTAWSDFVLFLPCDIVYEPDLLTRLLRADKDVISPYVWWNGVFYDTWAFSREGRFYANFPREALVEEPPHRMDTVGGVMLSRAAVVAAGVRYTLDNVDRGFCELARAKGFGVWADPTTHVWHGERRL